jgi:peroxiredoxin
MSTQEPPLDQTKSGGRNWLVLGLGLITLAALALFFIYAMNITTSGGDAVILNQAVANNAQFALPESGPPLQVGDRPYDFTLNGLDGNQVTLSEFTGRPLIINYWASWCGPCRIEMPHLQNAFAAHKDDGLLILALDQDETAAEVASFFDEFGLTFTPLLDEGQATSENYGVGRILPTTFFINPEGEITAIHRGPMTQGQIDAYLVDTIPQT